SERHSSNMQMEVLFISSAKLFRHSLPRCQQVRKRGRALVHLVFSTLRTTPGIRLRIATVVVVIPLLLTLNYYKSGVCITLYCQNGSLRLSLGPSNPFSLSCHRSSTHRIFSIRWQRSLSTRSRRPSRSPMPWGFSLAV